MLIALNLNENILNNLTKNKIKSSEKFFYVIQLHSKVHTILYFFLMKSNASLIYQLFKKLKNFGGTCNLATRNNKMVDGINAGALQLFALVNWVFASYVLGIRYI